MNEITMGTKTLKKLSQKSKNKPAAIALKIQKRSWLVLAFFLIPATAAAIMIPLGLWVPGLAWLE
jgi:hypothetical protein